jgi:hypothetical protein
MEKVVLTSREEKWLLHIFIGVFLGYWTLVSWVLGVEKCG